MALLMAGAIMTAGSDRWGTPQPLFANLHREFAFTVDLAADQGNHLLPIWFGPGGILPDGLVADWSGERGFCNPPFSTVQDWVRKAYTESQRGALVVMLLKVATGRKDFKDAIWPGSSELRLIDGRLKYNRPDGSVGATFDSEIAIFRPYSFGPPRVVLCNRDGHVLEVRRPVVEQAA